MSISVKYDFAADKSLTPQVGPTPAIVRASERTYFDASGYLQSVASGSAAFTHNPASLESLGLFVGIGQENICPYGNDLSQWSSSQATSSQAAGISPDGTNNANAIEENGASALHYFNRSNITMAATTDHFLAKFVKASNRGWAFIQAWGTGYTSWGYFNVSTGAVGTVQQLNDSGIIDVGNGWYLCWIGFTTGGGATGSILIGPASADGVNNFQGLSQESILMHSAFLGEGSFPVSHVPNLSTGTTAYAADVITATAASQKTRYTKFNSGTLAGTTKYIWSIDDGTANEVIELYLHTDNKLTFRITDGAVVQNLIQTAALTSDTDYEVACVWDTNRMYMAVDGVAIGTVSSGVDLPTVTTERLGCDNANANQLNSTIAAVHAWDDAKSDDVALAISNGNLPGLDTSHAGSNGGILLPQGWMWSR